MSEYSDNLEAVDEIKSSKQPRRRSRRRSLRGQWLQFLFFGLALGLVIWSLSVLQQSQNTLSGQTSPSFQASQPRQTPPSAGKEELLVGFLARVIQVADGDTVTLEFPGHPTTERVRLQGVDCPETTQEFGLVAKDFTTKRAMNQQVILISKERDRYNRLLGDIYFLDNGSSLGNELLSNGMAWHYKHYDQREELAQLEIQAQQQRLGLWRQPMPKPPWEYRQQQRSQNGAN